MANSHLADQVQNCHCFNAATSHTWQLISVWATLSQFKLQQTEEIAAKLQDSLSKSSNLIIQQQLDYIKTASQLFLSAAANTVVIQSHSQALTAHWESSFWLDAAHFNQAGVKQAKIFLFPLGTVNEQGKIVHPLYLGEHFQSLLSDKYNTHKHAEKVAQDL